MDNEIIIVDDDTDDQFIIKQVLDELGVNMPITCFENGLDALNYLLISPGQPFIIFCDINMPVMNGIEFKRAIFDNEMLHSKSIPFIFLTTTASPAAVEEAYAMSVQGFFEKEADLENIKRQIKQIYEYWSSCCHPKKFPRKN